MKENRLHAAVGVLDKVADGVTEGGFTISCNSGSPRDSILSHICRYAVDAFELNK